MFVVVISPTKNLGSIKAFKAARNSYGKTLNIKQGPANEKPSGRNISKGGNKQKGERLIYECGYSCFAITIIT